MKAKWMAGALLVSLLMAGCSINGTEVISQENKDKLTQKADELLKQKMDALMNNAELKAQLASVANLSPEKVELWMNELVKNQVIQQANQQLGEDVVQQVITEVTANNRGVLDAAAIVLIQKELEKRMGQ